MKVRLRSLSRPAPLPVAMLRYPPYEVTASGEDLIPTLYGLHAVKGRQVMKDVTIHLTSLPSTEYLDLLDYYLVSRRSDRLKYLAGRYLARPMPEPGCYFFPKGCIMSTRRPAFGEAVLDMRNISEWFRKLFSDILYARQWLGEPPYTIHIPQLQLRTEDVPSFSLFYREVHNGTLHPRHALQVQNLPALKDVVRMKRSTHRRYAIRYYYLLGQMDWPTYLYHRTKKWRHRTSEDYDPIWDTLMGWRTDAALTARTLRLAGTNPPLLRPGAETDTEF